MSHAQAEDDAKDKVLLFSTEEVNELIGIFVEDNPECTLEETTEFVSWANNTRFMAGMLDMILERKAAASHDKDGELCFHLQATDGPNPGV